MTTKTASEALEEFAQDYQHEGRMTESHESFANALMERAGQLRKDDETPTCEICKTRKSHNPHAHAGVLGKLNKVGYPWECIPCLVNSLHTWANRANTAIDALSAMQAKEGRAAAPNPHPIAESEGWILKGGHLPELTIKRHTWMESERVFVLVSDRDGSQYAAFGRLQTEAEWRIEGHQGAWHDRVLAWMPIPVFPPAPGSEGGQG